MFFEIFRSEAGFIGLTFNLFFVILAMRQSIWCWSMRIFSILAYLIQLYVVTEQVGGSFMWLAMGFIVIDIYGWYTWASIKEKESDEPQENDEQILDVYFTKTKVAKHQTALFSNFTHLLMFLSIGGIGTLSLFSIDYWFQPYIWYILVLILRLVAEFCLARKWIECWLSWAAADLLFLIPLLAILSFSKAVVYSIPIILAVVGYISWQMMNVKEIAPQKNKIEQSY